MATHSSVLAWRIPGTGEPGRHRVGHDWSDLAVAAGQICILTLHYMIKYSGNEHHRSKLPDMLLLLLSRFSRVASVVCDPIDGSPPSSALLRILQARTLEWVAISFSNALKWKVKVNSLSRVWLFATPMDCSLPGFSIHRIFQARVLDWVAIAFSTGYVEVLVNVPAISSALMVPICNCSCII